MAGLNFSGLYNNQPVKENPEQEPQTVTILDAAIAERLLNERREAGIMPWDNTVIREKGDKPSKAVKGNPVTKDQLNTTQMEIQNRQNKMVLDVCETRNRAIAATAPIRAELNKGITAKADLKILLLQALYCVALATGDSAPHIRMMKALELENDPVLEEHKQWLIQPR